jgi:hypothetical protein
MSRPALSPDPVLSAPLWIRLAIALLLAGLAWAGVGAALGSGP